MNREIKFRGKSKDNGKWLYGNLQVPDKPGVEYFMWDEELYQRAVYPETVGQYTGLKDKNGKDIYEGDILSQGQDLLGVACISMRYGISVKKETTTWSLINFVLDSAFDTRALSDVEVVGNIYDNQEMMEGEV